jgi:hypothetical protein
VPSFKVYEQRFGESKLASDTSKTNHKRRADPSSCSALWGRALSVLVASRLSNHLATLIAFLHSLPVHSADFGKTVTHCPEAFGQTIHSFHRGSPFSPSGKSSTQGQMLSMAFLLIAPAAACRDSDELLSTEMVCNRILETSQESIAGSML